MLGDVTNLYRDSCVRWCRRLTADAVGMLCDVEEDDVGVLLAAPGAPW